MIYVDECDLNSAALACSLDPAAAIVVLLPRDVFRRFYF